MSIVLHRKDGVRVLLVEGLVLSERDVDDRYTETFAEVCALVGAKEDPGPDHMLRGEIHRKHGPDVAKAFRAWPLDERRAYQNALEQNLHVTPLLSMAQIERRKALDLPPIKPTAAPSPKG